WQPILSEHTPIDWPDVLERRRRHSLTGEQISAGQVHHRQRVAVDPIACLKLPLEVHRGELSRARRLELAAKRRRGVSPLTPMTNHPISPQDLPNGRAVGPGYLRPFTHEHLADFLRPPAR